MHVVGQEGAPPMTSEHHQAADRNPVSLKRLLVGTAALPAAVAGLMMAFAVETSADAHEYEIASTVFPFPSSDTQTLSGMFSFSASTLLSVALTLSGDGPGTNGSYTLPILASGNAFIASTASE